MIEYNFYNIDEFNNLNEDIKCDVYFELVNEFRRKLNENKSQYYRLVDAEIIIKQLKQLLHEFIDVIGSDRK